MGATSVIQIDDVSGNGPLSVFDVNNGRDIIALYKNDSEVFALCSNGFIRTTTGWAYRQLGVGIGDIAANNDAYTYPLLRAKHDITIYSAHIACDATVANNTTNYQTVYLEQTGSTTDLSSFTTASTGFTARVPREFTSIDSTAAKLKAGQTLQLRVAKTAAGVAMYGVTVEICFTIDNPNATVGTVTDNIIRVVNDVGTAALIKFDHYQRPFLSVRENGVEKLLIDASGKMQGSCADQYYYQTVNVGQIVTADSGAKKSPIYFPHCTIQLERVYMGTITTYAPASTTNFWQMKITDGTNILVDHNIHGPYGSAPTLTKGVMVDMGDVNQQYARLTTSNKIIVEYLQGGTGPDTDGVTFTICYRKLT